MGSTSYRKLTDGLRVPCTPFRVRFEDGSVHEGVLDTKGRGRIEKPVPGRFTVEYTDLDDLRAKAFAARAQRGAVARDVKELLCVRR